MTVSVRRIYEPVLPDDGTRVLVDRLWPRGVSKERAHLDEWFKDMAPSNELRQWYHHDPERFDEFVTRYRSELAGPEQARELQQLRDLATAGHVTLLTATRDPEISEAAVIAEVLDGPRHESARTGTS